MKSKSEDKCRLMEDPSMTVATKERARLHMLYIITILAMFLILVSLPLIWYYQSQPRQDHYVVIQQFETFAYGKPRELQSKDNEYWLNVVVQAIPLKPFWNYGKESRKHQANGQQMKAERDATNSSSGGRALLWQENEKMTSIPANCSIPDDNRFDCHPEAGSNKTACEARGCCWYEAAPQTGNPKLDVPWCYYTKDYPSYSLLNETKTTVGIVMFFEFVGQAYYPKPIRLLQVNVTFLAQRQLNVKIFDPVNARYEVPYPNTRGDRGVESEHADFEVSVTHPSTMIIKQKSTGITVFQTFVGGFIYTDQFIQISVPLPSKYIYGLGERRDPFLRSVNWQQFTMFATDQAPRDNSNLYGSHPFFLVLEPTVNAAVGTLLLNSNAMDVILQPAPAITYRTIGGILDFHIFAANQPNVIISEYVKFLGLPSLPPYWGLGFHLCRFGYNSSAATRQIWEATRNAGIPFDVQWNDIDYMDHRRDFTYDKTNFHDLPQLVDDIHKAGMHYIIMMDPGIDPHSPNHTYTPYDDGVKDDIFIKNETGDIFLGKVWSPYGAAFPDFTNPKTTDYWTQQLQSLHNDISFDGLWIDMNEPSNFLNGQIGGCPNSSYENPPYVPAVNGGTLRFKTLCMTAKQNLSIHYNVHNLYGFTEAIATNKALKQIRSKRPFIISRSTFPGHGHYAGHWTGDIFSTWEDMQKSIPGILDFGLFGIPLVGADICGFNHNSTAKLCQRWMELGAFYPFSRNHNSDDTTAQDPVSLGSEVITASRKALELRYLFLPYLYTLFYRASVYGETVARPLLFEFMSDPQTYEIDSQFLWGSSMMILPVLEEDVTVIHPYFPKGRWYLYDQFRMINSTGSTVEINAPLDVIHIAFRGGYILPTQKVKNTTTESRTQPFGLVVALDEEENATGELFWDDGESLDVLEKEEYNLLKFTALKGNLESTIVHWGATNETMTLGMITALGVMEKPSNVTINGNASSFTYDASNHVLLVTNLTLSFNETITASWK